MEEGKTYTLSIKEAWEQNVSVVADFIDFVAYLEQELKENVLKDFVRDLVKDLGFESDFGWFKGEVDQEYVEAVKKHFKNRE